MLNSNDLVLVFFVSAEYYRTAQPCARTAGSCRGQRLLCFIIAGEVTSVAQDNNKGDKITTADCGTNQCCEFFSIELQTHPAVAASEDVINPRTYAFGKYEVSRLEMTFFIFVYGILL